MIRTVPTTTAAATTTIPIKISSPAVFRLSARAGAARTRHRATVRNPRQRYLEVMLSSLYEWPFILGRATSLREYLAGISGSLVWTLGLLGILCFPCPAHNYSA